MKSFEARRPYNSAEQEDEKPPGIFEFSLEAEAGAADQEFSGTRRSLIEMLIRNPAFKSEKAQRALNKLRETWKAAEEDLPEELKNELRHEHKDASPGQGPVHISTVLADAPSRQPGLASMASSQTEEDGTEAQEIDHTKSSSKETSIYRQAVIGGFAAAVITLIVFVLSLFLR